MAVPEKKYGQNILHRALAGILAAAMMAGVASAQRYGQPKKKATPRALALVEWPAKGAPRLVPVCILIDGRFYDAGIYKADPVPLALDPGNVYEVEHSGDPEGFFTIHEAAQRGDNWFGVGAYSTLKSLQAAEQAPSRPKTSTEGDDRPRLVRPKNEEPENKPATPQTAPESAGGPPAGNAPDSDRPPVLRKPAPSPENAPPGTQTNPGAAPSAGTAAPSAGSAGGPPAPTQAEDEEDPNRPRLRRGKPAAQIALETMEAPASAVSASATPGAKAAGAASIQNPAALTRVLPAISDAKGPEPRSFLFDWTPQEQAQITAGMQDMARASLQEYLKGRDQAAGPLQEVQVKAFDLDLSNDAVFVLTATAGPAPPAPIRRSARGRRAEPPPAPPMDVKPVTYFVTVVARQNLEGKLRRVFRRVTDSAHLDAYSRLELIDAVDADGDGRGELFFRAINDQSRAFILYRAGVDNLTEVFNSGELER